MVKLELLILNPLIEITTSPKKQTQNLQNTS